MNSFSSFGVKWCYIIWIFRTKASSDSSLMNKIHMKTKEWKTQVYCMTILCVPLYKAYLPFWPVNPSVQFKISLSSLHFMVICIEVILRKGNSFWTRAIERIHHNSTSGYESESFNNVELLSWVPLPSFNKSFKWEILRE